MVNMVFEETKMLEQIKRNENYRVFFFNDEDLLDTGLLSLEFYDLKR